MKVCASKKILLQHYVLGYRTDLYFPKHKLAIQIDEKGHKDRNKYKETERQKAIEKDLDCKFIRINPDEKYHTDEIGKIYNHINRSFEQSLIGKISKRLTESEFESNHLIKLKCLKYVFKIIFPSS